MECKNIYNEIHLLYSSYGDKELKCSAMIYLSRNAGEQGKTQLATGLEV